MATIITKNSSTASSVPSAGSLQQGELAVNVTDKKLYTKDSSAAVVKLVGSLGNQEANAAAITGGTINGTAIGGTTPSTAAFTTASASGGFTGNLTGNASTVTNGVYTTGSYADPAWITSLAGSKITGNISGNAANVTGTVAIANGGTGLTALGTGVQTALGQNVTGSGGIVLATSPTLTTPNLGTPSAATLTNATGLPVSTGISGLGTNVATALAVNVGSAGAFVVNGGALGTPSSGTLTNATGLPISTGVSGLGTGVATALAVNTGTSGAVVVNGGALGTPSSGTLTNATGLPLSTGVTGTLAVANGGTGVTTSTGTGSVVLSSSPALTTPNLGTPSAVTLTNATGLPLSTGVTGTLAVANGGTGQTSYTDGQLLIGNTATGGLSKATLTAGSNVTITNGNGTITIAATGGGSTSPGGSNTQVQYNSSGTFAGSANMTFDGTSLTLGGNPTLSAGTANGVAYLNASKVLTTGSALTFDGSQLDIPAGTASAPSLSTTADANTGLLFPAADTVAISTGGTERMRLDSSGNLGLGVTPSAWFSSVKAIDIGTATSVWSGGMGQPVVGYNVFVNSAGNLIYKTSAFASRYEQVDGQHLWYSAASGTAGNAITFTQVLQLDRAKSLALQGATSQSGTGITFPATQSASSDANTLDDYEEGDWTPSLGGTATYLTQVGRYVKIGRSVTVSFRLRVNSIGTGSTTTISGLPFTTPADTGYAAIGYFASSATNVVYLSVYSNNSTSIVLESATAATSGLSGGNAIFQNNTEVQGAFTYQV